MKQHKNKKQANRKVLTQSLELNDVLTRDVIHATLVVSLLINLIVLIGWLALQVTARYDAQVAQLLFS